MTYRIYNFKRLALILCGAATAACASGRAGGDVQLLGGTDWHLVELNGRTAMPANLEKRPWMRFDTDSGRVSGSAGCNRLTGPFNSSRGSLHFGTLASTKMACLDQGLTQQEIDFLAALHATDRFSMSGDTLTLMKGATPLARFSP